MGRAPGGQRQRPATQSMRPWHASVVPPRHRSPAARTATHARRIGYRPLSASKSRRKSSDVLKALFTTMFCSVLQPSSILGLATPWTYFLHLSPSSVILIDSSTESPVHVLMLSIQAMRGLPRLCAPGIVHSIFSFARQLPCFLMV